MAKLLIADDEPWIVTGITTLVHREFPDVFEVFSAGNGLEAMQVYRREAISVIISDVKMPRMSGLDMIDQLREDGCEAHVIFISGYDEFSLVQKALQLRSVDYLLKPIREEELVASLRKCLGCEEAASPLDLSCDHPAVTAALSYIKKHYTEEITLEEVAQHCAMSPVYISRLFRKCTGKNYIQVVTALRIEKAKKLLRNTHEKVYIVGEHVGYGDYRHFTKVFKQTEGLSPNEYRQKHAQQ